MPLFECPACGRQISVEAEACPQCGHPNRLTTPARHGLPLPAWARAAVYGVAWLPSVALLLFYLPGFEPIFMRLEERGELPALSAGVLRFGHLSQAWCGLPALVCFTLIVLADIGVGRTLGRFGGLRALYWAWFTAVIALGLLAALLIVLAMLLPAFKMGPAVP